MTDKKMFQITPSVFTCCLTSSKWGMNEAMHETINLLELLQLVNGREIEFQEGANSPFTKNRIRKKKE